MGIKDNRNETTATDIVINAASYALAAPSGGTSLVAGQVLKKSLKDSGLQDNPLNDADLTEGLTEARTAAENALDAGSMEGAENFTDHYYLTKIIPTLAPLNAQTVFPFWTSIRQNEQGKHPSYLTSYFEGWQTFLRLRPHQVSALQPYFRLSLVSRKKKAARFGEIDKEIPIALQGTYQGSFGGTFSTSTPEAALVENYHESMLGLKSFNWKREAGTGDAGKKAQTVATLKLFGNNLSIFERHPYDKTLARTALGYGLKIVVGWSPPPDNSNIFSSNEIAAIKNAKDIIYLQTTMNTFDFKQDGTFTVDLKCVGSTNDFMRGFDLLGGESRTRSFVEIDSFVEQELDGDRLQKKIDDRVKTLENTPVEERGGPITEAMKTRFQKDDVASAYEEAVDAAVKGKGFSEEDIQAYKDNALAKVKEQSDANYTGDSPTYLSPDGLREIHSKHIVEANKTAQKQRTHERMSRIQEKMYKAGAIKIVKVDKEDFRRDAAKTKQAIAGRREYVLKLKTRLANQQTLYEGMGGKWEIENGDTRTLKETDEMGFDDWQNTWSVGIADSDQALVGLTGKDGSEIGAQQWLEEQGMLVDHGFLNMAAGAFSGGATLTDEETDKKFYEFQLETEQMQKDDPFGAETQRRSALVFYRTVVAARFSHSNKNFITKEGDIGTSREGVQIYSAQARALARLKEHQEKIQEELDLLDKSMADGTDPPEPSVLEIYDSAEAQEALNVSLEDGVLVDKIDGNNPDILENHYISYFFLGDLINAIYEMAKDDGRLDNMPYIALSSMTYVDNTREIGKAIQDKAAVEITPIRRMIQMADIPISVKRYNAFYHKYFIQELVEKLPVTEFLTKVFEVLIRPVFSGEAFDMKLKRPNADFINYADGEMTKRNYEYMVGYNRVNLTSISPTRFYKPETNVNIKPYIMITANLEHQAYGNFNYARDVELGIPHYYLGADAGVVKTVAFTAVQNKFDQTDRAVKASTPTSAGGISVLKTPYHVNMTTIGNPMFKLGTVFLMLPTMPGGNSYSAAKTLGLGGYYRVISKEGSLQDGGTYETSVYAINENNQFKGDKSSPSKSNEKSASDSPPPVDMTKKVN